LALTPNHLTKTRPATTETMVAEVVRVTASYCEKMIQPICPRTTMNVYTPYSKHVYAFCGGAVVG